MRNSVETGSGIQNSQLAYRKCGLILTINPGTAPKIPLLILFQLQRANSERIVSGEEFCRYLIVRKWRYHLCNASVGQDVTCVYEPVKHLCCLFYQVILVGVIFKLLICQIKVIVSVLI